MVIIASSHFMHKTAKRQCLQDEEGKGCPFDFDNCVNNTHTPGCSFTTRHDGHKSNLGTPDKFDLTRVVHVSTRFWRGGNL